MRSLNTRSLADVRHQARERAPLSRKGMFILESKLNNKHHKMYRQFAKPPGQQADLPPIEINGGDEKRYAHLESPKGDSLLFAVCDSLEMKMVKLLIVASSDYLYTPAHSFGWT